MFFSHRTSKAALTLSTGSQKYSVTDKTSLFSTMIRFINNVFEKTFIGDLFSRQKLFLKTI